MDTRIAERLPQSRLIASAAPLPYGGPDVPWVAFDAEWYLATYPEVCPELDENTAEAALYFYLQRGRNVGHSPNIYFDEAWYIRTYADAADAIRRGEVVSGFEHYCRSGFSDRSPHWLFDEALYRRNYPQLTDDVLHASGFVNGYDHYIRHGAREGRIAHDFFAPALYREQLEPQAAAEAEAIGPFRHYLQHRAADLPEPATTHYLDATWYLTKYPQLANDIAGQRWQGALHHYLCNEVPTAFDPLPEFSESYYLDLHPDVAQAVAKGELRNGFDHFLRDGRFKLNAPNAGFDLRYYGGQPAVRDDLKLGHVADAFTHFLAIGRRQGLATAAPEEEQISKAQARMLFRRRARDLLVLFARSPLSFARAEEAQLSVVVPVHSSIDVTAMTLGSLRNAYPDPVEVILVDAGAKDKGRRIEQFVEGAQVLRLDVEIGTARSQATGFHHAGSGAVLFLGSEIELAPGAVAAALHRLDSDPAIGAVGGKVIAGHGILREAGGVVGHDGTLRSCHPDALPLSPEANFVRDVDFCSSSFLLIRTALLQQLDGFDTSFDADCYVAADVCARIAQAGFRIVYDPAVVVHDHSPIEVADDTIAADRDVFMRKHADWLAGRADAAPRRRRVLFIESMVPSRLLGSGFVRSNDVLRVMASLGCAVTVFPLHQSPFDPAVLYRDMPDTVEVMHDRTIADLAKFLADRAGCYDVIWVGRTHNLDDLAQTIQSAIVGAEHRPRIVLDTEAVASVRDALRAALPGQEQPFDLDVALAREFANAGCCDSIVTVSRAEAKTIRALGHRQVAVIGHMRAVTPTPHNFEARAGLLFVGAIREMNSPNYDGLCWFADEVLPLIEAQLGWETRLTVAGDTGEGVTLDRFRGHPRITLRGLVADLEPLYNAHRLFVAPTRYAAGIPYKLHEAASFGLPIVATDLLAGQLGWTDGRDLAAADSADPVRFAERVVSLYRDETQWQSLRDNAIERLRAENSREQYTDAVRCVLEGRSAAGVRVIRKNEKTLSEEAETAS
jgi:glycosyltransferase involved in cell wall biosynthesis